jgi:hypothetical protein
VKVRLPTSTFSLAVMSTAVSDVGFHANDGFDAGLTAGLVEFHCSIHVSMICQGKRFHALITGKSDHIWNGIDAIEQAVVTVDM